MLLATEAIDEDINILSIVEPSDGSIADDETYQEVTEDIAVSEEDDQDLDIDAPGAGKEIADDLRADEIPATEGELFDSFKENAGAVASASFSGLRTLASFSGNALLWLGFQAKALGIAYGPSILAALSRAATKTLASSLYLLLKFRNSISSAVQGYLLGIRRMRSKHAALAASLEKLNAVETTPPDPEKVVEWGSKIYRSATISKKLNPIAAMSAIRGFLQNEISELDKAIETDVRAIELLIENSRRGIRFSPIMMLNTHFNAGSFSNRRVEGYAVNEDLLDTYAYRTVLPNGCLPMLAFPKPSIIKEASETEDTSTVAAAYHGSFFVLAAAPSEAPREAILHYMDKRELSLLLNEVDAVIKELDAHMASLKQNAKRVERLKLGYSHYIHWATAQDEQKNLRQELLDIIHLKQHFVTKVYLPAMLDIHDYAANQALTMLSYARQSIKQIKVIEREEPTTT